MASSAVTPAPSSRKVGSRPETLPLRTGYIKVRLSYLTPIPQHVRSLMLRELGGFPPYTEDVCVLMPRTKVYAMLESFLPAFERLQQAGILHEEAQLIDYTLLDGDNLTLAYVI